MRDWFFKFGIGDYVVLKEDRHVGRVNQSNYDTTVNVQWIDTGWKEENIDRDTLRKAHRSEYA